MEVAVRKLHSTAATVKRTRYEPEGLNEGREREPATFELAAQKIATRKNLSRSVVAKRRRASEASTKLGCNYLWD